LAQSACGCGGSEAVAAAAVCLFASGCQPCCASSARMLSRVCSASSPRTIARKISMCTRRCMRESASESSLRPSALAPSRAGEGGASAGGPPAAECPASPPAQLGEGSSRRSPPAASSTAERGASAAMSLSPALRKGSSASARSAAGEFARAGCSGAAPARATRFRRERPLWPAAAGVRRASLCPLFAIFLGVSASLRPCVPASLGPTVGAGRRG
jgi:hypothetical protein